MTPTTILFDLDGTLVDSAPGIESCARIALTRHGLAPLTRAQLARFIGPPLRDAFVDLGVQADLVDEVTASYREVYAEHGVYEFSVFPGIEALLAALVEGGFVVAVATAKLTTLARVVVDHADLAGYFRLVAGVERVGWPANKTDVIAHALAELDVAAHDTVMVGDRVHDLHGARANGTDFIAASWGYGPDGEFAEHGDPLVADEPADVLTLVEMLSRSA